MADQRGSLGAMFWPLRTRDRVLWIVPGVCLALGAGAIPPLMAKVMGSAFNAFANYNPLQLPSEDVPQSSKDAFTSTVHTAIWQLCALAAGTIVLSTSMISVWIVVGEKVARGWRLHVYSEMSKRDLKWYDVDLQENAGLDESEGELGAGGLMSKFARETDDIRMATSQQAGEFIQQMATILAALILAFVSNWSLTLVVLASIPLTFVVVGQVQKRALPHHLVDMENMAKAGKELEQSAGAISTVKAFTAEERQSKRFMGYIDTTVSAWNRLAVIYGARMGLTATITLIMFTSGFWYGSYLVQQGKSTPGEVLTTFWSCLLVSTSLTEGLQLLQQLELGKVGAASLTKLVREAKAKEPTPDEGTVTCDIEPPTPGTDSFTSRLLVSESQSEDFHAKSTDSHGAVSTAGATPTGTPTKARFGLRSSRPARTIVPMRKIWPGAKCTGEISIHGLSFSYPSRPQDTVLRNISMFIPAGETTFIIGGSGSGKSTISHLLLGLYEDYTGVLHIDDQDVRYLDPIWARSNIAAVEQNSIIFDMSVHDNVALGLCGKLNEKVEYKPNHVPRLSRARVKEACRMTLLDRDIAKMPQGYDTKLGAGGINLSGGQKQRLALARAIVRDPPVLVLDEATSALDVKGRLLVGEFIREWRRGKTTVIITHDLKQVREGDFVYMLEQGNLIEQGYRIDLEARPDSRFRTIIQSQRGGDKDDGQSNHEDDLPSPTGLDWRASRALTKTFGMQQEERLKHNRASMWASDFRFGSDRSTTPNPADVLDSEIGWDRRNLATQRSVQLAATSHDDKMIRKSSIRYNSPSLHALRPTQSSETLAEHRPERPSVAPRIPSSAWDREMSRFGGTASTGKPGHQRTMSSFSSASSSASTVQGLRPLKLAESKQEQAVREMGTQKSMELASVAVSMRRPGLPARKEWSSGELGEYTVSLDKLDISHDETYHGTEESDTGRVIEVHEDSDEDNDSKKTATLAMSKLLMQALRECWSTQPRKAVLLMGFVFTVLGACTQPTFSFLLGKLLATMGRANASRQVLIFSLAVLGLAFADGALQFSRFALLQHCANIWIRHLRSQIIAKVFRQEKAWFDDERNSSSALLIKLVKDGEDAKSFVSRIIGELILVVTLLSAVLIWALIVSWQLTLAGMALGPLFYLIIALQSKLIMRFERQNKLQRERVAKRFYNMVHNVREIRSMALEDVFGDSFRDAVHWVERYGIRSAPFSGFGYGLKDGCTYLAQAMLYYVGSVLLLRNLLTFERLAIVANLIVFGVTYATAVIAYLPNLSKAIQALHDLVKLLHLRDDASPESWGCGQPVIQGAISFRNVYFSYPARPDDTVLNNCSFDIGAGESVALVGQSGCGKSTVAALVQRLYEPQGGVIVLDDTWPINSVNVHHLRHSLACVAQKSDLFDDTIRNNILLGNEAATPALVDAALRTACCKDFIDALDAGLDTRIGEDASNLSGGQKQRLAIARALVRTTARIRILDECTSALDPENQARVAANLLNDHQEKGHLLNTASQARPTTLIVTHKLELMKRCDRILVMEHGRVVQSGNYRTLLAQRGGAFSKLASAGEWGS